MEILSVTNRKTQLHKSPSDLSVICSHDHLQKRTVSSDISFFQSSFTPKCFAQTYKTDTIEIWRVKTAKDGTETFDKIRKMKIEGIQAISCGKTKDFKPEYAMGFTSGQIKVMEFNEKNTLKVEFPPDRNSTASVISLDFSSCGGYLSSVYENGTVNIYGLKTKIKADIVKVDKDITLARFNPTKRFHLALASFQGGVTVYDMSARRIHFQQKDAHAAPCRDIAMPEDIPHRLLSCGCDSLIKIFDTRQKATGLQIQSSCGLSTISISKCGGFFAVGNLKGDIITYDMRCLRQPLTKKKVDDELVTRIAFMPSWGDSEAQFSTSNKRESTESTASDLPDFVESINNFTIEDLVEFHNGRPSDFERNIVSPLTSTHEPRENSRHMTSTESKPRPEIRGLSDVDEPEPSGKIRLSEADRLLIRQKFNDMSADDSSDVLESPIREDRSSILDRIKRVTFSGGKKESLPKRRSSILPMPLQRIREEHSDKENKSGPINTLSIGTPTSLGPRFSSTPTTAVKTSKEVVEPKENISEEIIDVDALESSAEVNEGSPMKKSSAETLVPTALASPQSNVDFKNDFEALYEKIGKIHFEVQSLNMDSNGRHIEMMTYIHTQRRELQSRIQMVEECMGFMMNDDFKISRIMELQEENRTLRSQLEEKRLNR